MVLGALVSIAPALVLAALFFLGLPAFSLRVSLYGWPEIPDADRRKETPLATPFVIRYVLWLVSPLERTLARLSVAPDAITLTSLAACAASGVALGTGHLAIGAWVYIAAGLLDVLDGRVARRQGRPTSAGALLDSVVDRWGEFFALGGLAFHQRHAAGVGAVLLCIAGSQMVSYVRARGESLGVSLAAGTMQRGERMALCALSLLAGAVGNSTRLYNGNFVLGVGLAAIGLMASVTSVQRLTAGLAALRTRDLAKNIRA